MANTTATGEGWPCAPLQEVGLRCCYRLPSLHHTATKGLHTLTPALLRSALFCGPMTRELVWYRLDEGNRVYTRRELLVDMTVHVLGVVLGFIALVW